MPAWMHSLAARVVLDTATVPAKLPRSAYQLWMKQSGPAILKEVGGTFSNVGQRAKVLSAEWKKVSEEERSRSAVSSLLDSSCPRYNADSAGWRCRVSLRGANLKSYIVAEVLVGLLGIFALCRCLPPDLKKPGMQSAASYYAEPIISRGPCPSS